MASFEGYRHEAGSNMSEVERVADAMSATAERYGLSVVNKAFHAFNTQGMTGVLVLAESHFSIHTWPESGFAAVDLFTCNRDRNAQEITLLAIEYFAELLGCKVTNYTSVKREGFSNKKDF
mgnify:FL=1